MQEMDCRTKRFPKDFAPPSMFITEEVIAIDNLSNLK